MSKRMCACCGEWELYAEDDFFDEYEICPICGWQDDHLQNDEPNYAGGANEMCLNDARKHWETEHTKIY